MIKSKVNIRNEYEIKEMAGWPMLMKDKYSDAIVLFTGKNSGVVVHDDMDLGNYLTALHIDMYEPFNHKLVLKNK